MLFEKVGEFDNTITLRFPKIVLISDGAERVVDFEPFLSGSLNPLIRNYLDLDKFKQFSVEFGDLSWNDYDLCFPIADLYDGRI